MAVAPDQQTEHLTIVYEDAGDGWITARIPETGAISQGVTRAEARANVIAALYDLTHPKRLSLLERVKLGR